MAKGEARQDAARTAAATEELLKQVAGNTSHLRNLGQWIGGLTSMATGFIKATTALAPVMETMGAKFSKSFEDSRADAMIMSKNFGVPHEM